MIAPLMIEQREDGAWYLRLGAAQCGPFRTRPRELAALDAPGGEFSRQIGPTVIRTRTFDADGQHITVTEQWQGAAGTGVLLAAQFGTERH